MNMTKHHFHFPENEAQMSFSTGVISAGVTDILRLHGTAEPSRCIAISLERHLGMEFCFFKRRGSFICNVCAVRIGKQCRYAVGIERLRTQLSRSRRFIVFSCRYIRPFSVPKSPIFLKYTVDEVSGEDYRTCSVMRLPWG